ncbi:MAG: type III-A CRISPR-associated protein Csm2 [Erysipelotrichaceae bacterium]|nr:type III-A CRISPR-associated protein Csm2 [Erysipelotrichaceae bacterium]
MDKRFNNKKGNFQRIERPTFPVIEDKLSIVFSDPVELYLPTGKACRYAKQFSGIPAHQMRKILNGVKEAKIAADNGDLKTARSKMFVLVAMSAYNAGRLKGDLINLKNFITNTVNEKSVVDEDDIDAFDQFFTSVVAYHTQFARKK